MAKGVETPFGFKKVALLGFAAGFSAEIGWVFGKVVVYYFLNLVVQ